MLYLLISVAAVVISIVSMIISLKIHYETQRKLKDYNDSKNNNKCKNIPKVIHFMYGLFEDGKDMKEEFVTNIKRWQEFNRDYRIIQWDRIKCEELISGTFPEWETIYFSFTRKVQRSDLMRYLILKHEGGWYFDLDCTPVTSISNFIENVKDKDVSFVVFTEKLVPQDVGIRLSKTEPIRNNIPEDPGARLANYAIGSERGHVVWDQVLMELKDRCNTSKHPNYSDYEILYTTGPDCLTHVINRIKNKKEKQLLVVNKTDTDKFVLHKATGTWRRQKDAETNNSPKMSQVKRVIQEAEEFKNDTDELITVPMKHMTNLFTRS